MLELNEIYNIDCLTGMTQIADKSIDMIFVDLPYQKTQNSWDVMIPFEPMWEQFERIIKDNGAILLFGQDKFTAKLMLSNEKLHRYNIVWDKVLPSGFLNAKKQPLRSHEDICVFYKKLPTYNPQMSEGKPYIKKAVTNGDGGNYGKFNRVGTIQKNEGTRFPRSVIRFSNDNHKSIHPTQKPVELLEYLIKTYSNEGDTVLDFCMGSGSTGVAAKNTNRDFIGMELDENYFEVAKKRIEGD